MKVSISATDAVRTISDLLNRVRYRGEGFVVERGGKPICEIQPAAPLKLTGADLADLLASLPKRDDEYSCLVDDLIAKQAKVGDSGWPR